MTSKTNAHESIQQNLIIDLQVALECVVSSDWALQVYLMDTLTPPLSPSITSLHDLTSFLFDWFKK